MSSGSALEAEELENVPLVRMEDVQPDRSVEYVHKSDEVYETCIVDGDFECVVDDEDSNIGSMVSIKSEEIEEGELIVPEVLDEEEEIALQEEKEDIENKEDKLEPRPVTLKPVKKQTTQSERMIKTQPRVVTNCPDSWPTLEILPGGVINLGDKTESQDTSPLQQDMAATVNEMMYACAKCSQSFKYLFCLVKHVRWHEDEARKMKADLSKLTPIGKKMAELERRSNEIDKTFRRHKGIADNQNETKKPNTKGNYICLHSGKRKLVSKPKVKKIPKKS